jgi:hypothetical protein
MGPAHHDRDRAPRSLVRGNQISDLNQAQRALSLRHFAFTARRI